MAISVLKPHIANQIAAGEVVERPASIVKELIENALDAGATQITVEIENGGLDLIRITDNGCGMSFEDAACAFLRHATSKISVAEDLTHIQTFGFRGEALPSIASVASVELRTKQADSETGSCVRIKNGKVLAHTECACANGTSVEVRELFSDVPARLKFLKSPRTEAGYIGDYVSRLIMGAPQISFSYTSNGRTVYRSLGDGSLKNAIISVYGIDIVNHLLPITFDDGYLSITGFAGDADISRPNRTYQSIFLNGRYIRSASLSSALMRAYETRLMSGKFPFAILDMRISGYEVDVNVHPAKLEVRFADEQRVIRSVTASVHRALLSSDILPDADIEQDTVANTSEAVPHVASPSPYISHIRPQTNYSESYISHAGFGHARAADLYASHTSIGDVTPVASRQSMHESAETVYVPVEDSQLENRSESSTPVSATENRPIVSTQQSFFDVHAALTAPDSFKTVGCVFDTYWMIENGEDLLFIDQHAAHERIIYEKLISADAGKNSQQLLMPVEISFSESEKAIAEEFRPVLEGIGASYRVDDTDGKFYLTAMPVLYGKTLDEQFFRKAVEICGECGSVSSFQLIKSRISQCACKHAVKAGDRLTEEEITALIRTFQTEGIPMTCPHGRPVMICLKKRELEKLFKRVL